MGASMRNESRRDAGDPKRTGTAGVPPASGLEWRSRGYLPHLAAANLIQHVVFRLADSLPRPVLAEIARREPTSRGGATDAALDSGYGGRDLAIPQIAGLTQTALLSFDGQRYRLIAWCIMPSHVHALIEIGSYLLDRIVHSWKSYTAKAANRLLERTGTFWAREYFDRFMRDEGHLARTAAYIEANPVKAGLCDNVSNWRFSSAWPGWGRRDAGGPDGLRTAGVSPACRAGATPAVPRR